MHDKDVEMALARTAKALVPAQPAVINKSSTLSFSIVDNNRFRVSIKEETEGVRHPVELYVDMPKEDLVSLSELFPEFVKKMEEVK